MNRPLRSPIVLVANNPFGHHLLTSQLLDHYQKMDLTTGIILLCNGITAGADPAAIPQIKVVSFASRFGGLFSQIKLLFLMVQMRFKQPRAVYHLRGFVAGSVFFLSRLGMLQSARYIYDPRGAFFIEWREAGRLRLLSRVFGWVEKRLIRNATTTIVTSDRFARLYRRLFPQSGRYLTIYNSTSFPHKGTGKGLPASGPVRFVYLGTFNHWHDINEIARIMACAARAVGPDRAEIYIYTSKRFHPAAQKAFGSIACARLVIDYVNYHDIPDALADKHVGVSVVRPSLSTRIASPIKVSDYVAIGLIPLLNSGIGDFDTHFLAERSAILYRFGQDPDLSDLANVRTAANEKLYNLVSNAQSLRKLVPVITDMLKD
jgi:hypothetical protein